MKRLTTLAIALVAIFSLTACSDDVTGPMADDKNATIVAPTAMTIAEIAQANDFTLLLGAINYIAGTNPDSRTVASILDDSDLTVFAPTDQAFLNLVEAVTPLLDADILANEGPFAAIDALLGAGTVEAVVGYHVTAGNRPADTVVPERGEQEIKTLVLGATFMVTPDGMIEAVGNSASIEIPNLFASNGIIHVIDTVLLPIDLSAQSSSDRQNLNRAAY